MLSVTAIAVITLTGSELSMSVLTSDRSKALLAAKAGAEKAAQVLDTVVAQAQEDARAEAEKKVKDAVDKYKVLDDTGKPVKIIQGSLFDKVIDISDISDIKIIDNEKMQDILDREYKYQFWKEINSKFSDFCSKLQNETVDGGNYLFSDVAQISSANEVKSILDTSNSEVVKDITVTSTGEYKSSSNGSIYKRKIKAAFSLLTSSSNNDIPVTYGKLTKVRINSGVLPSILSGKALIAEKNIISLDGTVNVNGNTTCFGTMPEKANAVDYSAGNGYLFGGIMAGMVADNDSDTSNYSSNFWTNEKAVVQSSDSSHYSLKSNMEALKSLPKYSDDYFKQSHKGSFKFNGDVSTAAYVHTLYGNSDSDHSDIEVTGNTYTRNFNVESESNYSNIQLNNICTYDDLRIDGNSSKVKIGKWLNDNTYGTDTNSQGCVVGLKTGDLSDPVSSSVIVAGDSNLFINGSVFVGGSTSYNDYTSITDKKPYISGMSIQKSDSRPAEAFEKGANELNADNKFYFYSNISNKYIIKNESLLEWERYNKFNINDIKNPLGADMLIKDTSRDLSILDKAMHMKYIWDNLWKNDIGYASYFNTGDIKIAPENERKQIQGFCWGGVAANDTIYGPYSGFTSNGSDGNVNAYRNTVVNTESGYIQAMDLFIDNIEDLKKAELSDKKKISASVRENQTINANKLYKSPANSFMYYSDKNIELTDSGIFGCTDSFTKEEGYLKGILYSKGDIYVRPGTNFKGILIAEGNIVFLGNANVAYDESVVSDLLNADQQIGRFFNHTVSDVIMNDPNAIVQTVKKKNVKNIKIISWKEI
jgi:hypothetical protein